MIGKRPDVSLSCCHSHSLLNRCAPVAPLAGRSRPEQNNRCYFTTYRLAAAGTAFGSTRRLCSNEGRTSWISELHWDWQCLPASLRHSLPIVRARTHSAPRASDRAAEAARQPDPGNGGSRVRRGRARDRVGQAGLERQTCVARPLLHAGELRPTGLRGHQEADDHSIACPGRFSRAMGDREPWSS